MEEIVGGLIGVAVGGVLVFLICEAVSRYLIRREFPEKRVEDYFWWRSEE